MASPQGPARRPTITSRAEKQRLREIAQLRARRAARRSNEVAAGKRRMVLSGFFAALTVLVGLIAAVLTAVSWAWMLLPFGALVGSLALSRRAAIRFEEVSRAEQARLEELMGLVPMGEADAADRRADRVADRGASAQVKAEDSASVAEPGLVRTVRTEASVAATSLAEVSVEELPEVTLPVQEGTTTGTEVSRGVSGSVEVHRDIVDNAEPAGATVGESADTVVEGETGQDSIQADSFGDVEAADVDADEDEVARDVDTPLEADAPATWVPTPIPAPMYAQRPRVGGRLVHPDTDLRGIPKVAASVPMRPSGVSESGAPLRSTEEVAAAQPVSFDLDAILESRRAL